MNNSNDDTYRIILNIKNCKELDKEDINNIRNMSNEGKMKYYHGYQILLNGRNNEKRCKIF